jgi:hypothetical protein
MCCDVGSKVITGGSPLLVASFSYYNAVVWSPWNLGSMLYFPFGFSPLLKLISPVFHMVYSGPYHAKRRGNELQRRGNCERKIDTAEVGTACLASPRCGVANSPNTYNVRRALASTPVDRHTVHEFIVFPYEHLTARHWNVHAIHFIVFSNFLNSASPSTRNSDSYSLKFPTNSNLNTGFMLWIW